MISHRNIALVATYLYLNKKKNIIRRRQLRSVWVNAWLGDYQRLTNSFCYTLDPLISPAENEYKKYVRMNPTNFYFLLDLLTPLIKDVIQIFA